jgi:hypothetical protein
MKKETNLMIFQNQISSIDSEINQLLAQVESARRKQAQLTELDALTDSSLTQLKSVVSKIEHYDKSAIANLKNAVLGLFEADDDSGDHGPNQPIEPTPDDDPTPGGDDDEPSFVDEDSLEYSTLEGQFCDIGHDLDWYWERCAKPEGQAWEFASFLELDKPLVAGSRFWFGGKDNTGTVIQQLGDVEYEVQIDGAICASQQRNALGTVKLDRHQLHYIPTSLEGQICDIDQAPKTGQKCSWASPFASPLCSLAWEDAPLNGQHCIIAPSATEDNRDKGTSESEAMPYVQLVRHPENGAIAYQRKHDGEIICVYVGFRTKAIAQSWMRFFEVLAGDCQLRESKRLKSKHLGDFRWEIKAKGVSMAQINRLASEDLDKSYRSEIGSAKPPSYKPQPKPEAVNPDEVQPGDIVTPLLTPGDSYEVLTVMPNGILDCKNLRTGVQMGMRPTAVSLVQKAQPTEKIEFNDLVEVIADGNDCVGLVGSFGRVKIIGESRIGVEIDEQLTYFKPSELRIKAKEEKAPQRQALQSGQQLMGDRIVTSGNYIGSARTSRLLSAQLGTAEKIATIQLAKDLKNLGFDPQLALTVMAGVDDASDF